MSAKKRIEYCSPKGIQNLTKDPTRKQSGSEREIKRGGIAATENGIYRDRQA